MEDRSFGLAGRYNALDGNLGQVLRRRLLARQLDPHLPAPPAGIVDVGGGAVTRGDTVEGLSGSFAGTGLDIERWYGVWVFTDHLGDRPPGDELPDVLELEWEAGRRDPYRSVARLIHIVGRKPAARREGGDPA